MIPLFGEPEAAGRRDDVEGLLIRVALRALALGVDVVLDFGVRSRDERTSLRHLAADVGATTRLHYLSVEPETQWRRLSTRDDPASFRIPRTDADSYAPLFEEPSAEELSGADDRPGDPSWPEWATSVAYAEWVRPAPPRTPNYLRFIVTGAIIGFIGGAIFSLVGESAPDYSSGTQIAFFGVILGGLGALLAGLVAVLLERRP